MPQQAAFGDLEDDVKLVAGALHQFVVTAATMRGSRLAVDHQQMVRSQPGLQSSSQGGGGARLVELTEAASRRGPPEHHRRAEVGKRRPTRERFVADSLPVGQRHDRLKRRDDPDACRGRVDEVRCCAASRVVTEIGHPCASLKRSVQTTFASPAPCV